MLLVVLKMDVPASNHPLPVPESKGEQADNNKSLSIHVASSADTPSASLRRRGIQLNPQEAARTEKR
jgi:hypothetical protein